MCVCGKFGSGSPFISKVGSVSAPSHQSCDLLPTITRSMPHLVQSSMHSHYCDWLPTIRRSMPHLVQSSIQYHYTNHNVFKQNVIHDLYSTAKNHSIYTNSCVGHASWQRATQISHKECKTMWKSRTWFLIHHNQQCPSVHLYTITEKHITLNKSTETWYLKTKS